MEQTDRLERGDDAAVRVRVEERRVARAEDDVGLVDEVLAAAGAHAVHGGDDGLPALVMLRAEARAGILVVPDVAVGPPRALLDVDAGAERALAGGAKHDGMDRVRIADGRPRLRHLLRHLLVEGVQLLGAIQRDRRDGIVAGLEEDRLEGAHVGFSVFPNRIFALSQEIQLVGVNRSVALPLV